MSEVFSKSNPARKRFIAGAVCPECKQLDTIVMFPDEQRVACVSCEYEEVMSESAPPPKAGDDDASVIRFVDPNEG